MSSTKPTLCLWLCIILSIMHCGLATAHEPLAMELRFEQPLAPKTSQFQRMTRNEQWPAHQTAVIVCDMWDSHHCVNAVRRVAELAPRIDRYVTALRMRGVTVIHAPSSCMEAYKEHPARSRAKAIPPSDSFPDEIANWCDRIPSEESASYPIDQSAGGEDDDPDDHAKWAERLASIGRNPKAPWLKQCDPIRIDGDYDYISDDGKEIWSILQKRKISHVLLVGVHTNMCVLGRPFGLRRLSANGKSVALVRDLTDTMYDPNAWPYVSHFTGTDLIVQHVERYVCPTVTSNQILGDKELRYRDDRRTRLAMLIAEDEYLTEETLPKFAGIHLGNAFSLDILYGSGGLMGKDGDRNIIPGIERVRSADALLVSVRRRPLSPEALQVVRDFVSEGKPVIGIRTASHAFSLRDNKPIDGLAMWPEFDAQVFGGNYQGHYGVDKKHSITVLVENKQHPILSKTSLAGFRPGGSLYKTAPLAAGTRILLESQLEGEPAHPVAWTFIRSDGGRSFYTSLGHPDDFAQPEFASLLVSGISWACGLEPPSLDETKSRIELVAKGSGKQRK